MSGVGGQGSPVNQSNLSDRQRREREYYEQFSQRKKVAHVSFEPVESRERRPWNSYWWVYDLALGYFEEGRRRLLDFGCGKGVSSLRFAKIGYEVWGFDISPSSIAIAESLALEHGLEERVHFSVQVAERLDYPSDYFDIICGVDILHHVELAPTMEECFRMLKKGGVAIFREPIEGDIVDGIRNSRLVRKLVPKGKSFDLHITEDERKLTKNSVSIMEAFFPVLRARRFTLTSRLNRFIGEFPLLERLDSFLFLKFPFLERFGGDVVLRLEKTSS